MVVRALIVTTCIWCQERAQSAPKRGRPSLDLSLGRGVRFGRGSVVAFESDSGLGV